MICMSDKSVESMREKRKRNAKALRQLIKRVMVDEDKANTQHLSDIAVKPTSPPTNRLIKPSYQTDNTQRF